MDSDDSIEKFHQSKILLDQKADNINSDSDQEFTDQKREYELTHEIVQEYLNEEHKIRQELIKSDTDDSENDDKNIQSDNWGKKLSDWRGEDKLKSLSRADQELLESAQLDEAVEKKRIIENLIKNVDYVDPEFEEMEDDNDSEKEDICKKENLSIEDKLKLVDQKYPKVVKYFSIYNQISCQLLPKVESCLKSYYKILPPILLKFLTIKKTILLDFTSTLALYFAMLFDKNFTDLATHPIINRLQNFDKILTKFQNENDHFYLLDAMVHDVCSNQQEIESSKPTYQETTCVKPESDSEYNQLMEKIELKKKQKCLEKVKKSKIDQDEESEENLTTGKREIDRKMNKNKGHILSKKKKIDRNPRVKHREKYRRAVVKRKGQVRPMRDSKFKYDGEYGGVKAGVIHSKKIS